MNDNYIKFKKDYSAFFKRRERFLARKHEKLKWEDSRQKPSRKTGAKNTRIRESIKAVEKIEKSKNKGSLVCINLNHLPSRLPPLPEWKYLDERNKVFFYQLAMEDAEKYNRGMKLTPFVFNISDTLLIAFYSQKKALSDYLRENTTKALKQALQRPVAFYFVIETAYRGKLHIQGSMLISEQEQELVKEAFKKQNRKMTAKEKNNCIQLLLNKRREVANSYGNLYATLNWGDYNLKEYRYNRVGHSLNNLTASSQLLTQLTHRYYDRFRAKKRR